jgi:hypothetical protein
MTGDLKNGGHSLGVGLLLRDLEESLELLRHDAKVQEPDPR